MKRDGGRDRLLVVLVLPPSATGPWTRVRHRQAVGVLVAHDPGSLDGPSNHTITGIVIR